MAQKWMEANGVPLSIPEYLMKIGQSLERIEELMKPKDVAAPAVSNVFLMGKIRAIKDALKEHRVDLAIVECNKAMGVPHEW